MKIAKALFVAVALSTATVTPAWSAAASPVAVGSTSVGAGPWIVGGVMVSALSLIVCAAVVSKATNKEMTSQQAIGAAILPFSCLWAPVSGRR